MTSNEDNVDNVKIHIKQCLNELNYIDELIKKATNNDNMKPMCVSQYNNMNVFNGVDNLRRNELFRGMCDVERKYS